MSDTDNDLRTSIHERGECAVRRYSSSIADELLRQASYRVSAWVYHAKSFHLSTHL